MKQILIVDDDIHIGDMLEVALKKEGYSCLRAYSGTEAKLLLDSKRPDLILLDLMLPGLSGEELLESIKNIPVIVVSAKLDVGDKVSLLMKGAVDYVTKPFELKELLARIVVALRNTSNTVQGGKMTFCNIELDSDNWSVTVNKNSVKLTRTEYAILKMLMSNSHQVVTKNQILDKISVDTPDCTDASLKIHISNLRRKLREASGSDYIKSVWGIGFKLEKEKCEETPDD